MALIKCPECGNMVSNQAKNCIHCGYPINENNASQLKKQDNEGTVIIYGIKQSFLFGATTQIYLDGKYYGAVKAGASLEIKITKDTQITAAAGIHKANYSAKVGKLQKLQIVCDRFWGTLMMQEIDVSIASYEMDKI